MTKRDIDRLERMAARLESDEARWQRVYGDAVKGTERNVKKQDAKALRAAVAILRRGAV